MLTQNVNADTWRFLSKQAEQMTDWSLGQTVTKLETALDECRDPDLAAELVTAIALIEEELEARCA